MQVQQLGRDNDIAVRTFKNTDGGGSVTTGLGVCMVEAGASIDAINAIRATAATIKGFLGVANKDVAINDYGTAICDGRADSVLISHVGSSITVTRGDTLKPGAVAGTFFSSLTDQALSTLLYKYVYAATTNTISAAAYVKGIVRAI